MEMATDLAGTLEGRVEVQDLRRALAVAIEDCRQAAWSAMRRDVEHAAVPLDWLIRHAERLGDLDRGLVRLDAQAGAGAGHQAAG